MIKQNINFVTSLPARQSIYLSFRFIKVVYAGFVVFLMVIYFLFFVVDHFRARHLAKLNKERTALNAGITLIVDKTQKSNESQSLTDSIKALKNKTAAQERVLKLLNTQQQSRFSVYLDTLSNQIPAHAWLDEIQIIPEKEFVFLSGYTLEAPAISDFIHRLNASNAFATYGFKSVDIKETKDNYFRFVITSENVSPSKNKGAS